MTYGEVIEAHLQVMRKIEKNIYELQQHSDTYSHIHIKHAMEFAHFAVLSLEFAKSSAWANHSDKTEIKGDFTITP